MSHHGGGLRDFILKQIGFKVVRVTPATLVEGSMELIEENRQQPHCVITTQPCSNITSLPSSLFQLKPSISENLREIIDINAVFLDPNILSDTNASILQFAKFSTSIANYLFEAANNLIRMNNRAFALVKQSPSFGDLDVISSLIIIAQIQTLSMRQTNSISKPVQKGISYTLRTILARLSKVRKRSEKVLKKCEDLIKMKDQVLSEFSHNKYLVVEDKNYKKQKKQISQEIDSKAIPIQVKRSGFVVSLGNIDLTDLDQSSQTRVLENVLGAIDFTLDISADLLKDTLKILKLVDFEKLDRVRTLTLESSSDTLMLGITSKRLENSLIDSLEAATFSVMKFNSLYEFKTPLKILKKNRKDYIELAREFNRFELSVGGAHLSSLLDVLREIQNN